MSKPGYYARDNVLRLDGTRVFQTREDQESERKVAHEIERAWSCSVRPFGALSPIDWYAERDGRLVGVIELKARSHSAEKYPTVYLNVRKWLALQLAAVGLDVPAIFVVRFTDGTRWIPLARVNAWRVKIGGCTHRVKSSSDVEPVIEIPVSDMQPLASGESEAA